MIWFDSPLLMGAAFLLLIFAQSSLDWLNLFFWFIGLASCFPFDGVRSWWSLVHLVFDASFLSFARYVALLRVLPLCLGIVVGVIGLLLACSLIFDGSCGFILSSLQAVFIAILLVVAGMLCLKVKVEACLVQDLAHPSSCMDSIFSRIIDKLRQTFSFGSRSFFKQDLEPIYKPCDWITYFNRKANNQDCSRLHPAKITLDKLVDKLELALSQAATTPPKLFVEQVRDPIVGPFPYITGDIDQIIYLLVQAVLRVSGKVDVLSPPAVRVQLHNTFLQFKQKDILDGSYPACMLFQATALVISNAMVDADLLPKVKNIYDNFMDTIVPQRADLAPPFIDLQQETIASIIAAHYGYLEYPADNKEPTMLLVLPIDVIDIMNNITFKVPITLETPLTHKEQTDAMAALMQFYDHVRQCACGIDPIDLDTISQLLVLLQQHFSFKRHASGQLFYVRAVGIAKLVLEWVFYAPKVVYASLLYGLVCHVQLPLSYVKDHYNLGVYTIVLSLLGLTKRQDLDHPSLVYVENRLEKAIKEDQVHLAVLCIKLAERLYDLGHAAGYTDLAELRHMAQETLAIDIKLADEYLDPEIARALKKNAKQALKACKDKDKKESKDKDKDS